MRFPTRHVLRSLAVALPLTVVAAASPAATVVPFNDHREGTISCVSDVDGGSGASWAIAPGFHEFLPVDFEPFLISGDAHASMFVSSGYIHFDGTTTDGLYAIGDYAVDHAGGSSEAHGQALLNFSIAITGLAAGQSLPFRWSGGVNADGGECQVSLVGPSVNHTYAAIEWDEVLMLGNGVYTVGVTATVDVSGPDPASEHIAFDARLARIAPTAPACGNPWLGCYSPHQATGCNDIECCSSVCAADSFCCEQGWDGQCVGEANGLCRDGAASRPIVDPRNGHRYRLLSPTTAGIAKALAFSHKDELAAIGDGSENEWLTENIVRHVPGMNLPFARIGLGDEAQEGVFRWSDGSAASYLHWEPGEPNGGEWFDSVVLSSAAGRWSDVSVADVSMAIAEESWTPCGTGGSCFEPHGPGCDDESCCGETCDRDSFCCIIQWDSICVDEAAEACSAHPVGPRIVNEATGSSYQLVSNGTWLQAERLAQSLGGHLAAIDDAAENQWLIANFLAVPGNPSQALIGFHDQGIEGGFRWTNHQATGFTAWASGEPNNAGGEETIAVMNETGDWNDSPLHVIGSAILEFPCAADLDGNGWVDSADLAVLLGAWGTAASPADLDHDAQVDAADLAAMLGGWGPCPSSNACGDHRGVGSDQPGCTACVCGVDPFCCQVQWDWICANEAGSVCDVACQCGG